MVRLFFKKLWRDMLKSGVTYAICVLIVAIGFCGYSLLSLCITNLEGSRDDFFRQTAFPDVFVELQQAPLSAAARLAALPGVVEAQGRLTQTVRLAGGGENPPELRLVSVSAEGLARPLLSRGQLPEEGARQVALGDGFFNAHGFELGEDIALMINGRAEHLAVSGSGISPENIYMVKSLADLLPDPFAYDAGFISYATLSSLLGKEGLANEFVLTVNPGTDFAALKTQIEDLLEPYGCYRVYERIDQFSVSMLQAEIDQVGNMTTVIPFVFLGVAAVILYITLYRLVEQQRVQAGTLLALGFSRREILLHYLCYGTFTGFLGGVLGGFAGVWAANPLTDYYRVFFSLPPYLAPISWSYFISGTLVSTVFCGLVGYSTARRLSALTPAEALRPAAPKAARSSVLERIPYFISLFTVPGVMAIRGLARNRRRAVLAITGIASAYMITAFLLSMNSMMDVFMFDYMDKTQRQDVTVYFDGPVEAADALSATRHPAVEYAEGLLEFPVTLRGPAGKVDCGVQALVENSQLCVLFDENSNPVRPEKEGIVLSLLMAKNLGVGIGDTVDIEVAWPEKRRSLIPVTGIVAQYMGSTAYMSQAGAARVSDYRGVFTSVLLKAPEEARQDLLSSLEKASKVSLVENRMQKTGKMREYMDLMMTTVSFMASLGVIIAFAVIYTSSLISFEELKREISTMMMLGLSSAQCLQVVSVGQWLLTIIAFGPGIIMTMAVSRAMSDSMASEQFVIPDFVEPSALFYSCLLIMVAVILSSRVMLRKIKKLSPVELLRERE